MRNINIISTFYTLSLFFVKYLPVLETINFNLNLKSFLYGITITFGILSMFFSKVYRDICLNNIIHFVDNKSEYDRYFHKVQHFM